jgi:hypothetical protein
MKKVLPLAVVLFVLGLTLYVFQANAANAEKVEKPPAKAEAVSPGPKVPASGAALWDFLKKEEYEKNWKIWPGTAAFHHGTQPHGILLTTYVNPIALKAIAAKKGMLPYGSIIVTENYSTEKWLESLTVMYKIKGYNPGDNDWFWAKYGPEGTIAAEGKLNSCEDCHYQKKSNDYIWTARLK